MHETTHRETLTHPAGESSKNVSDVERAASAVAGGAMVAYGLKQGGMLGTAMSLLGGGLLLRGATGHCPAYEAAGIDTAHKRSGNPNSPFGKGWLSGKVHVTRSITINRSQEELYRFWRNFENLPAFMKHLETVSNREGNLSHWKAKAPLGQSVEWDAEVTSDIANERIGWKSVEGSDIANSGVVEFRPTTNRGTEVRVVMTYEAPGGKLGSFLAWLFGEEPSTQIAEDLRRFKMLMETGQIITVEGQPSGRSEMPKARAARA